MSLTYTISDAEISTNPATGKITGDAAPGSTQDGVVTKMAKSHDELKADLEALKAIFDAHDHDPATGTGGGGPPIGTGGVHAIAAGAITTAKIADANVTYAKVAAGAVGSTAIQDNSIVRGDISTPVSLTKTIAASASADFTHNAGRHAFYHVECNSDDGYLLTSYSTTSKVTVVNTSAGSLAVTVRAYGVVSLS